MLDRLSLPFLDRLSLLLLDLLSLPSLDLLSLPFTAFPRGPQASGYRNALPELMFDRLTAGLGKIGIRGRSNPPCCLRSQPQSFQTLQAGGGRWLPPVSPCRLQFLVPLMLATLNVPLLFGFLGLYSLSPSH